MIHAALRHCEQHPVETVIRGLCVDPVKVLESDLHQAMKRAAVRDLVGGCWQKTEYTYKGRRSSRLRVDVVFVRKWRDHLVECETRPSVKRLMEKGGRRNGLGRRTVYILVVPAERYRRLDIGRLKGYFDQVIAYDAAADEFTCSRDLRFMGSLRDAALDVLVPLHRAISTGPVYNGLRIRKNLLKWAVRGLIQCSACRLGIDTPWIFCPRDGCLRSGS